MKSNSSYKYSHSISEWKLSKRNQLVKKAKEIYIRNDIPCGFTCCSSPTYSSFIVFSIISKEIMEKHKSLLKSDFIRPIICQSEFNKLSTGDQKRINDIINQKSYVFFYDQFFENTSNKDLEGVLDFYKMHLQDKNFIILNEKNIKDYAKYFDSSIVQDLVDDVYIKEFTEYEEYNVNAEFLYNSGNIFKSTIQVDPYNWRNGTIFSQNKRIRILGINNMNRAINGDEVYVQLITEPEKDEIDLENDETEETIKITEKSKKMSENEKFSDNLLYGKVIGISKRNKTELIGTILNSTVHGDGSQFVLVLPIDKKYPPVRIRTSQPENLINRRIWVELEFWEKDSKYPSGHYFKNISNVNDFEGEISCVLLSNNITYYNDKWKDLIKPENFFDIETLKALENNPSDFFSLKSVYHEVEIGIRKDFRHLNIFSVDPEGCTDVDDALHIIKLQDGNFEVGVHIADVSHYVKPGSALDDIASDRGTTVYLPDRRIDMLPEFLSAGLCSLLENQERATFSVMWKIDSNGKIISTEFTKALIKSCKAFSYEEAYKVCESKNDEFLKQDLMNLYEISKSLRLKRQSNGALDLSASKVEIKNNKIFVKESIYTNTLIEEFMLLANISVAEFLHKNSPERAVLRKHPPPSEVEMPIEINLQSSFNVNEVMSKIEPEKKEILKKIVTRAMNQATYVLGSENTDFYHYGLATPLYTHFTSPIRRYADILVHRLLSHILNKPSSSSEGKRHKLVNDLININDKVIDNINRRHSSARRCSMDVTNLFLHQVIKDLEPITFAYVTEIKANGVIIFIPEFGINEALPLNDVVYKVFDKVKIKICKDDELFFYRRRFKIEVIN